MKRVTINDIGAWAIEHRVMLPLGFATRNRSEAFVSRRGSFLKWAIFEPPIAPSNPPISPAMDGNGRLLERVAKMRLARITKRKDDIARAAKAKRGSPFLSTEQAAFYLGLSPRRMVQMRASSCGPEFRRHCRFVRYHIDDLDFWSETSGSRAQNG